MYLFGLACPLLGFVPSVKLALLSGLFDSMEGIARPLVRLGSHENLGDFIKALERTII